MTNRIGKWGNVALQKRGKKIFGIAVLSVVLGIAAAPFVWGAFGGVMPGVTLDGRPMGHKSHADIEAVLAEENEKLAGETLTLTRGAVKETWKFSDLKVHCDEDTAAELLSLGRTGSLFQRWADRWRFLLKGEEASLDASYDKDMLKEKIKAMEQTYGKPPKNPSPTFHNDGSVTFSKGRPHIKIDEAQLLSDAGAALTAGETAAIDIPATEETQPSMSEDEAKQVNTVLAKYTTEFYGDPNRSKNIHIAADSLDGVYVKPGADFSYNRTTGPRSKANGYLDAPVIINGKLEPGSGGGVCQVSTTLFNAVLLAGLQVTERTCHFSPISYAPLGRDATVAEGYLDFCFHNDLKHGVYLYTEYAPGSITVFVLGNKEDKPSDVKLTKTQDETVPFKTVTKVDPSQKEDKKVEEGHEGRNVTITQDVKWADGRIYHDTFYSDYEAVDTVVTYKETAGK